APSVQHLLGVDGLGRDTLSRLMAGAQISLIVGIGTQILVLAVGVPIGLAAGYFRGAFDQVVTFLINLFYGIPDLLVALILVFLLGPSLTNIIIAIAVTRWMDMARLVRGQTLSLREREFIEAARAAGAKPAKILFGHILPNALGPIIVKAVDGVTFDLYPGESLGIVGESGSGKSMTALSLLRLVPDPGKIVGGKVLFRDQDLMQISDEEIRDIRGRDIAMIFQDPQSSLNPVLQTGFQIAEAMLAHKKATKQQARQRTV